jgi:3-oxoacyl-[acyl-carrier protein] reductase
MAGSLQNKVAVVTGGGRGIGRAIAYRLASEGADCMLVARTTSQLQDAAKEISTLTGRRVEICSSDLRTSGSSCAVLEAVETTFHKVDILVNSAGATQIGNFLELSDDVWQDGFALKFFGAVRVTRLLWPMLKDSHGVVINIIGGYARTPTSQAMIPGSVNAALTNFSKALAGLGLEDNVNVNAVHPGLTVTERLTTLIDSQARLNGTTAAEEMQAATDRAGIRRLGTTEDVANLVAFLCSSEARHVHGAAIAVDGGATKGMH